MAKKPKKYAGKTEEEWRDWGEKFGKNMEKHGKEFGKEMEGFGKKFEKRIEQKGEEWKSWWARTFGPIGPIISSVFGIACLGIGILLLHFINILLGSSFIYSVSDFLFRNLHWFFAFFLFFGYNDYFSKRYPKTYWTVAPLINSIGIVILIFILVWLLNLINTFIVSGLIATIANFLYRNLTEIFILCLVLGYIIAIIKKIVMNALSFCEE